MLKIADTILNLMYPKKCIFCNAIVILNNTLCNQCEELILPLYKTGAYLCPKCGYPLKEEKEELCKICKENERYFVKNISLFPYTETVKYAVYSLKYRNGTYLKRSMAEIMSSYVLKSYEINFDYIIPVPMYKARLMERGYNQTELLASEMSKILKISVLENAVIRHKDTTEQNQLSVRSRKKNLENAFLVVNEDKIKQKLILIVDDVFTSGATVNEMSKALMDSGARAVYSVTFAIAGIMAAT